MQILLRLGLLATMLVVIFINPAYIGRSFYNLLLLLLLLLGALFWYSSQRITKKDRRRLIDEPIVLSRSGSVRLTSDGSKRWITILLTKERLYLLERQGKSVEIVTEELLESVSIERVEGRKRELLLLAGEEEYLCKLLRPKALLVLLKGN